MNTTPNTTTPTVDLDHLAELRAQLADAAYAAEEKEVPLGALALDVERYLRLAEYCVAAAASATTGGETSDAEFGFVYVALSLLEPEGSTLYNDPAEYKNLAFDAVSAITERFAT